MTQVWSILCREQYVTSCERVQYRVLRKWLRAGFEQSLQCASLAEPPEACASNFCLELSDNVITCCTGCLRYFSVFIKLISDTQNQGVYVTFV